MILCHLNCASRWEIYKNQSLLHKFSNNPPTIFHISHNSEQKKKSCLQKKVIKLYQWNRARRNLDNSKIISTDQPQTTSRVPFQPSNAIAQSTTWDRKRLHLGVPPQTCPRVPKPSDTRWIPVAGNQSAKLPEGRGAWNTEGPIFARITRSLRLNSAIKFLAGKEGRFWGSIDMQCRTSNK